MYFPSVVRATKGIAFSKSKRVATSEKYIARKRAKVSANCQYEVAALATNKNCSRLQAILRHYISVAHPMHSSEYVPSFRTASKIARTASRLYTSKVRQYCAEAIAASKPTSLWMISDASRVAKQDFTLVNYFLNKKSFAGLAEVFLFFSA